MRLFFSRTLPIKDCELNFIEKCWAYSKYKLRGVCDYTFASLASRAPEVLRSIPVEFFGSCFRSCSRYVLAYGEINGQYLTFEQVRYAHKKYSSHRRIKEAEVMDALRQAKLLE